MTFRWKDYAIGERHRKMTLDATEFIGRFLLHVLSWVALRENLIPLRGLVGPAESAVTAGAASRARRC